MRLIRVSLVFVKLNPINDTYIVRVQSQFEIISLHDYVINVVSLFLSHSLTHSLTSHSLCVFLFLCCSVLVCCNALQCLLSHIEFSLTLLSLYSHLRVVPSRNWKTWNPEPSFCLVFQIVAYFKPNPGKWSDDVKKSSHLYQVPGKSSIFWKYYQKLFRNLAASHRTWNVTFRDENVTSHLFVTVPHSNPGPGSGKISSRNDPNWRNLRAGGSWSEQWRKNPTKRCGSKNSRNSCGAVSSGIAVMLAWRCEFELVALTLSISCRVALGIVAP